MAIVLLNSEYADLTHHSPIPGRAMYPIVRWRSASDRMLGTTAHRLLLLPVSLHTKQPCVRLVQSFSSTVDLL